MGTPQGVPRSLDLWTGEQRAVSVEPVKLYTSEVARFGTTMLTSNISGAQRSGKEFSAKSRLPLGWTLELPGLPPARSGLGTGSIEPVKVCAAAMTVLGTASASFNKSIALTSVVSSCISTAAIVICRTVQNNANEVQRTGELQQVINARSKEEIMLSGSGWLTGRVLSKADCPDPPTPRRDCEYQSDQHTELPIRMATPTS